ncbi:MAG TPA: molybdopterin converting factor subunit 1 [Methylophilaceae bacterium]|jgi:molybdopterin synthase sulfur carrier subunit
MQITVLYFARLKESLKYSTEEISLPESVSNITSLKSHLASRGGAWQEMFSGRQQVRAAINHALVTNDAAIKAGDEVAFFPPVTGG